MYNPFYTSMMLAIESQKVIELRLVRIAWGGQEADAEIRSMVTEKMSAAAEAGRTFMLGGAPETVIAQYREQVATNVKRLSAS